LRELHACCPISREAGADLDRTGLEAGRYVRSMFDHVAIHVADLDAAARFYRTVFAALGIAQLISGLGCPSAV
jgi:hypothetical protein